MNFSTEKPQRSAQPRCLLGLLSRPGRWRTHGYVTIFTPARTGRAARGFSQANRRNPRDFKEKPPGPKTAAAREERSLRGLLAFVVTRQTNSALTRR